MASENKVELKFVEFQVSELFCGDDNSTRRLSLSNADSTESISKPSKVESLKSRRD